MKRLNLIGKKYGKWTPLEYTKNRSWRCQCECGTISICNTTNLTSGKSRQCFRCANMLPFGEANFNGKLSNYKANAKQRGLIWSLASEEARVLFKGNCFYCGVEPLQKHRHDETNGYFLHNGIDRVDSAKGYIKENCVSCCKKCNYMKRDLSKDDFVEHIRRILQKIEAL